MNSVLVNTVLDPQPPHSVPIDKSPAFAIFKARLEDLANGPISYGLRGYGIEYLARLSTPGAVLLVNTNFVLYPGCKFEGYHENLTLQLPTYNKQLFGDIYFLVRKRPDAQFFQPTDENQCGRSMDLIFRNTVPFTDNDLTSFNFVGQDGVTDGAPAAIKPFYTAPYKEIHAYLQHGALVGGTAPTITLGAWALRTPGSNDLLFVEQSGAASGTDPAAVLMGTQTYASGGTNQFGGSAPSFQPIVPEYTIFEFEPGGSPTGWSNAFLSVYGVRH